jgi:hypothetical protein
MHGDFARMSFNAANAFTRVFPQQGRMLLESELNEQTAIHLHFQRQLIVDTIGKCWRAGDGFSLSSGATPKDFEISPGRLYVDGICCELGAATSFRKQPFAPLPDQLGADLPDKFVVYAECWERHRSAAQLPALREVALHGRDTASRAQIAWQIRLLTRDMVAELKDQFATLRQVRINNQSPFAYREGTLDDFTNALNASIADLLGEFDAAAPDADVCKKIRAFMDDAAEIGCLMRARARYDSRNLDPCALPADAQFRSRENQLYRVEIHHGGPAGTATFKWSRENGSIEFAIHDVNVSNKTITASIETLGRDRRTGLCEGDWVEVTSDAFELGQTVPPLAQVTLIDRAKRVVTMTLDPDASLDVDLSACTLLRRWDQTIENAPTLTPEGTLPVQESSEGRWTHLERGVQVQFVPGGFYRTGDYWLVPARVETNDVIWPQDGDRPAPLAPQGIERHRGSLGYAVNGNPIAFTNCACAIKPQCEA